MQALIETKSSVVHIDEEGILRIRINDGYNVTLKDAVELFELYRKLGCDKNKKLQLMEGERFFSFDQEAQKYAAQHGGTYFIASALVNNSLAIRMLFNFFHRFFTSSVPFKMFPSEKEALAWLRSFKKK